MSEYTRGDIVLVTFPFSDLSSLKLRPALVLTVKDDDLIILGIFSYIPEKIKDSWVVVEPVSQTGLKKKSVIKTEKIAVIHHSIVKRKLGTLPQEIVILVSEILSYRNFNKLELRQPFTLRDKGLDSDRQSYPIRPSPFDKRGCPKENSARSVSRVPIWKKTLELKK